MSEFKYVPVEPTEEMLAATSWPNCAGTDYRHMLAAAPTQPAHPSDSRTEFSDTEMLDWFCNDMAKQDDGIGIYFFDGGYCFPYLDTGVGGLGGGVCLAKFDSLREAIKAAMQADREGS